MDDKLQKVINLLKNTEDSMYKISKTTGISEPTLSKIVSSKTSNLHERTLKALLDYFEKQELNNFDNLSIEVIVNHIIENEKEFLNNKLFKLWIDKQKKEAIIKYMSDEKRN
ncbi:hypothetical protein UJ101_01387 [Flavobacteriaceae bacterium UJ101]|nr:hypothetical protein UJ101_01387 [Flavobacteriaceae bacterium UJ101]